MKVENHHDSLSRFYILQPFEVSPINDKGALHTGDGPMPWKPFSIGVHETDRYHFDEQFRFLLSSLVHRRISLCYRNRQSASNRLVPSCALSKFFLSMSPDPFSLHLLPLAFLAEEADNQQPLL